MCPSKKFLAESSKFFITEWNISQILLSLAFKIGDHKHNDINIFLYICQFVEWDDLFRTDTERCSENYLILESHRSILHVYSWYSKTLINASEGVYIHYCCRLLTLVFNLLGILNDFAEILADLFLGKPLSRQFSFFTTQKVNNAMLVIYHNFLLHFRWWKRLNVASEFSTN